MGTGQFFANFGPEPDATHASAPSLRRRQPPAASHTATDTAAPLPHSRSLVLSRSLSCTNAPEHEQAVCLHACAAAVLSLIHISSPRDRG
eukprot:56584-Rhodomonas_salina.1